MLHTDCFFSPRLVFESIIGFTEMNKFHFNFKIMDRHELVNFISISDEEGETSLFQMFPEQTISFR